MTARRIPASIAGVVGGAVSLLRVDSYDEMFWVVMAERLIGKGDLPYFDMVDNKGPLLYILVAAAVLLPWSHSIGLAVLNGLATAFVFDRLWTAARSVGSSSVAASWWAAIATGLALVLATGAVTTEFLAVGLVAGALTSGTTRPALVLIVCAAAIDPRALLFVVPVGIRLRRQQALDNRVAICFACLVVVAIVLVIAIEPLRFSLFELSIASRITPDWPRLGRFVTLATAPMVLVSVLARPGRVESWALATGVTALAVGFLGGLEIGHYWVYLALTIVAVPWVAHRFPVPAIAVAGAVAILPLLPVVLREVSVDQAITTRTADSNSALIETVRPDDEVFVWSEFPHLRVPVADQTVGAAASSNIYGWSAGTDDFLLGRLEIALSTATLIVIDAPLESPPLRPSALGAPNRIREVIGATPCVTVGTAPLAIFRCDRP